MAVQNVITKVLRSLVLANDRAEAEEWISSLRKAGFPLRADIVSHRNEFEAHLRPNSYDFVLANFALQDWSGMDALAAVRNQASPAPFILVADLDGDVAAECLKQGAADYVSVNHLARLPLAVERALSQKLLQRRQNGNGNGFHLGESGLRLLFANSPLPMYVYDLQSLRFLQVNDAATEFYGYSREHFSRMTIFDIRFEEDSTAAARAEMDSSSSIWFSGEWRHQKGDGSMVDVEVIRHLIQLSGREAGLGVVHDISERKRAERELAFRARRQSALAAISQRALGRFELNSIFSEICEIVAQTLPIEIAGVLEWKPTDGHLLFRAGHGWNIGVSDVTTVNDSYDLQPGYALLRNAAIAVANAETETRFALPPLFASHSARSSVAVVIPGGKQAYGVLCGLASSQREFPSHEIEFLESVAQLLATIVERHRAESALQSSETRYRELIENTPLGIFRATIGGEFAEANPALVRMLGYSSREELIAQPVSAIYENVRDVDLLISQYAESGDIAGVEIPWKRKDGSRLTVRLAGRAVPDATGNPLGLEIIVQDLTERHELEARLHQSQKFEALGQLAGKMAHDFNNVIGAIVGWAELGSEQSSNHARLREYFTKIGEQANRAGGFTRQLLAIARRQLITPQDLQLNNVLSNALPLLESIVGPQIDLVTRFSKEPATIRADSSQIEQMVTNLCVNSRDAMPTGGTLTIETKILRSPGDSQLKGLPAGRYVQLTVRDTGIGMDAAMREHIFDPFFTTKDPGKGSGLGLTTVFSIVTQHDGYVKVESEAGHGSTFRIILPSVTAESGSPAKHRQADGAPGTVRDVVLIAEDHEGVREVARVALERAGYSVLLAGDGLNALEHYRRNPAISLVVMDLVMPRMGGHAAVAQMREGKPDLPVIFTTGYAAEAVSIPGAQPGRDVVLRKPYESSLLLRHVRELLERRRFHEVLDTLASNVLFRSPEGV